MSNQGCFKRYSYFKKHNKHRTKHNNKKTKTHQIRTNISNIESDNLNIGFNSISNEFKNKKNNTQHGVSTDAHSRLPLTCSRWKHQPKKFFYLLLFSTILYLGIGILILYNSLNEWDKYSYISFVAGIFSLGVSFWCFYVSIQIKKGKYIFEKTHKEKRTNHNNSRKNIEEYA